VHQTIEIEVEVPLIPALGIVGVIIALSYYFFRSSPEDEPKVKSEESSESDNSQ